ncbi:hypothetical protein [Adhaeribacter radiodurans]|uniref:Uncharacterized protein n=1 Tax=Adhaeribacter radiodurans TaxID=2745197 RepID=A0A7L7L5K9_9BACT|nr:hypothetical protein [Adhaeribacter radiodurans]QMU28053.1 hypothetical protein HUW48_08335 [Adhaeribacter radiodurans]
MFSACPPTLKSDIYKAEAFLRPNRVAKEAFLENIKYLLASLNLEENSERKEIELLDLLHNLFLPSTDREDSENSSPICYAHTSGLRNDFLDPFTVPQNNPPKNGSGNNRLQDNPELASAIQNIKRAIVLTVKATNPKSSATRIEKHVAHLVYQLYDLTPAEIKIMEENDDLARTKRHSADTQN